MTEHALQYGHDVWEGGLEVTTFVWGMLNPWRRGGTASPWGVFTSWGEDNLADCGWDAFCLDCLQVYPTKIH